MAAYLIASVQIHDTAAYDAYRKQVPGVIEKFGGRFLVRGGAVSQKEGEPILQRTVVLEFPDMAAAEAFYHSEDYAPLIRMRQAASTGSLALVEGFAG